MAPVVLKDIVCVHQNVLSRAGISQARHTAAYVGSPCNRIHRQDWQMWPLLLLTVPVNRVQTIFADILGFQVYLFPEFTVRDGCVVGRACLQYRESSANPFLPFALGHSVTSVAASGSSLGRASYAGCFRPVSSMCKGRRDNVPRGRLDRQFGAVEDRTTRRLP